MSRSSQAERILYDLSAGLAMSSERLAVIVAHPDDETLGIGSQLPNLAGNTIVT